MKYTVAKEFTFEAAHSLPHLPDGHKCRNLHGHSYKLIVCVTGPLNPRDEWVVDYADVSAAVQEKVIETFDHKNLNEFFMPSTCERLAKVCWSLLKPRLPGLCKIQIHETPTSFVTVEE